MPGAYNRLTASIRAFLEEVFSDWFRYSGQFQYVCTSCDYAAQTCDLDPVNPSLGMPPLVAVPIRSPLLAVKLAPGEPVTVAFENNDPAYPFVCGLPSGGKAALPVVRQGDMCWVSCEIVPLLGMFTPLPGGVPPAPSVFGLVVKPAPPFLGPPAVPPTPPALATTKLYGIAATGSQSVKAR